MAEAFLIAVVTPREEETPSERRLFLVLSDTADAAVEAVQNRVSEDSIVELTGIPVLPETVRKLGLLLGKPRQL